MDVESYTVMCCVYEHCMQYININRITKCIPWMLPPNNPIVISLHSLPSHCLRLPNNRFIHTLGILKWSLGKTPVVRFYSPVNFLIYFSLSSSSSFYLYVTNNTFERIYMHEEQRINL